MANNIQDFGEKIGGARKDTWRTKGLSMHDIEELNLKEYIEFVTKDNVWPKPNYESFIGKMEPVCIYYMRMVREKVAPKTIVRGKGKDKEYAIAYIKFLNNLKELCINTPRLDDIQTVPIRLKTLYVDETGRWSQEASDTPGLDNSFMNSIRLSDREIRDLNIECEIQNFPYSFRGDLKGATIRKSYYDNSFVIGNSSRALSKKSFSTFEEALQYAKNGLTAEIDEGKQTKKVSSVVNIVRPQLEFIERIGPDNRKNTNVTGEQMIAEFGFRGGEFGNWNSDNDRQAYLNYAHDSFTDLAYILGVPTDFIGLGWD